nr:hypothetical protein [Pseudomonas chlororaphis]
MFLHNRPDSRVHDNPDPVFYIIPGDAVACAEELRGNGKAPSLVIVFSYMIERFTVIFNVLDR